MVNGNVCGQENSFRYSYSAPQHDEVRRIREKYMPKAETPMEQLRRLDKSCGKKGTALSVAMGSLSSLILGVGMCCCMVWGGMLFVPGVAVGLVGMAGVGAAYPLYMRVTRRERQRIAPEILRLADGLLK